MPNEPEVLEPMGVEGALPQVESAPVEAAEAEVEEAPKEEPKEPTDLAEALKERREARRDATKATNRAKRLEQELARQRQYTQRPPAPTTPAQEYEMLKGEAMAYRQMQQERFIDETLGKLGLQRDDPRIDWGTPEAFALSTTAAKAEDIEDREAELADKEKELESLGDKLRAENDKRLQELWRDFRREKGLDDVGKPTPAGAGGTTEEKIRAKYEPQLKELRGTGRVTEASKIKRQMEKEIKEAQDKNK
mgnify:CR=1 FL=1